MAKLDPRFLEPFLLVRERTFELYDHLRGIMPHDIKLPDQETIRKDMKFNIFEGYDRFFIPYIGPIGDLVDQEGFETVYHRTLADVVHNSIHAVKYMQNIGKTINLESGRVSAPSMFGNRSLRDSYQEDVRLFTATMLAAEFAKGLDDRTFEYLRDNYFVDENQMDEFNRLFHEDQGKTTTDQLMKQFSYAENQTDLHIRSFLMLNVYLTGIAMIQYKEVQAAEKSITMKSLFRR